MLTTTITWSDALKYEVFHRSREYSEFSTTQLRHKDVAKNFRAGIRSVQVVGVFQVEIHSNAAFATADHKHHHYDRD